MFETKKKNGFGLIEVLVSIAILTAVVLTLNFLAQMAYYSWENAQYKTAAYNIIQDATEYIRNTRDQNVGTSNGWFAGLATQAEIEKNNGLITMPSGFTREIKVSDVASDIVYEGTALSKKKVEIKVSWKERRGERSLASVTYFTDWKSKY
ncbi:prepilin-type N-terminal cleavage/methylation domain-containing protein [Candidatus Microgenomates bacterium]|nr:prepilin-type N-terminal cleavage/methylation domain-containing protein [Candidatus Microgenomates bacterium]